MIIAVPLSFFAVVGVKGSSLICLFALLNPIPPHIYVTKGIIKAKTIAQIPNVIPSSSLFSIKYHLHFFIIIYQNIWYVKYFTNVFGMLCL